MNMESTDNKILNRTELAAILGVSPRTVTNYRKEGMPAMVGSYKMIRYDLQEVKEWLSKRNSHYTE